MSEDTPNVPSSARPDKEDGWPEDPSRRPSIEIEYVSNVDRMNTLFDAIVAGLQPSARFYAQLGQLVYVDPRLGVTLLGPHNFNGFVSSYLEIERLSETAWGLTSKGFMLLGPERIKAFVGSPRVLAQFPTLSHFSRAPVFDREWTFIATPGYHARSGIYYAGPAITPMAGTSRLEQVLGEFCWQSPIDRVNYLGILLTALTMLHWFGRHPLCVFNANQPGLGKTLLARLVGLITDGTCRTVSYCPNDEEFEKQLATCVESGDRTIVIDNAKWGHRNYRGEKDRTIDSPVLERSLTDPILNYRRLGSNTAIRRPNDVIFSLTMNKAALSPDLRRRSIPMNLEFFGNVRTRAFSMPDLEAFVLDHRGELLAELAAVVVRWRSDGGVLPEQPARHSMSQSWAATTDAMLQASGFAGFLENFTASDYQFDAEFKELEEVCAECHDEAPAPAKDWARRLVAAGLLRTRLFDEHGQPKGEHAQATVVGTVFAKYVGVTFATADGRQYTLASTPRSKSHDSVAYWFQPVEDSASSGSQGGASGGS